MAKINLNSVLKAPANTDTVETNGNLEVGGILTVANGVSASAGAGTFTATGTTGTTVSTTSIALTDCVVFGLNTAAGSAADRAPYISAITAGTSFVVKATTGDTSVYNWAIIKRQ